MIAQEKGRFTVWSVVDALTRLAQQSQNAGDRTEADEKARISSPLLPEGDSLMASTTRSQPRPSAEAAPPAAPGAARSVLRSPRNGQAERRQPVFTWSHPTGSGRIEIAVWDKVVSTDNGEKVFYHVTCQRSYRKQEGGYENTGIFWHDGLAGSRPRIGSCVRPHQRDAKRTILN